MAHRLGQRAQAFSIGANCGYLANWFDFACDHPDVHPDLEAFVTGLRALVAAGMPAALASHPGALAPAVGAAALVAILPAASAVAAPRFRLGR